ncbi:hypothetical protein C8J56DRAFT_885714 [Mycena floridula]|nr:hypothetical protein C8J56DRAFT_885714 [Mycena floridula]
MAVQFLKLLQTEPHIQKYIKRVELVDLNSSWLGSSAALASAMKILSSSLISLHIVQRISQHSDTLDDISALEILSALEELSITQEVRQLILFADHYTIPRFCNNFPRLGTLDLRETFSKFVGTGDTAPKPPTFQLQMLKLGACDDYRTLEWLLPTAGSLRKVHLSHSSLHIHCLSAVSDIILGASASLKELYLEGINVVQVQKLSYVLEPLREKTKSLCTLALNTHLPLDDAIELVTGALQLIGPQVVLEYLLIGFMVSESALLKRRVFETFENIILGPQFPTLKCLELHITAKGAGERRVELAKKFPRISGKGRLLMRWQKAT